VLLRIWSFFSLLMACLLKFSGECLVQQRLLQRLQRGVLPLGEAAEALGFFHAHFFFPPPAFSLRNCFFHDIGGARHIPSARTKAQTLGMLFLAQMTG